MYTYILVTGDWSNDGHNQSETHIFETTHNVEQIRDAYLKAVKVSKVALHEGSPKDSGTEYELCADYENNSIPKEAVDKLSKLGVSWHFLEETFVEDEEEIRIGAGEIAILFME